MRDVEAAESIAESESGKGRVTLLAVTLLAVTLLAVTLLEGFEVETTGAFWAVATGVLPA